jgi:hypothetical protein
MKHGLRSAYLPSGILERYETALADPELLKIKHDVATVEGMLGEVTSALHDHRPIGVRQEKRILSLLEARRRLIEAEARRLKDLGQMLSLATYLLQMTVVGNIIRKHLGDKPDLLDAVHADLVKHLLASAPTDQGDDDA